MKKLLILVSFTIAVQVYGQTQDLSQLIPRGFLENKGQIFDQTSKPNSKVKYLLNRPGFDIQIRQTGFSYDTYTDEKIPSGQSNKFNCFLKGKFNTSDNFLRHFHRVDVELLNCNPNATLICDSKSEDYFNYFIAGASISVHYYQMVTYKDIYPNIDLEFINRSKGNSHTMPEYQFIVHPGGNPSDIKLFYKGANNIKLENGLIKINVAAGNIQENIPSSYFKISKEKVFIQYISLGNDVFAFSLPDGLTIKQDLIIDPVPTVLWCTYYGGAGVTQADAIALDANNNVIVTGWTNSTTNLATSGTYQSTFSGLDDSFIGKFNNVGSALLWGTYYGGNNSGEQTIASAVAVDGANNIFISGKTTSGSGISTSGAFQTIPSLGAPSAFVAKFQSTGSIVWGTYFGPSGYFDAFGGVAVDASDNVYITGQTGNSNCATPGVYQTIIGGKADAYIAKFNSSGSVLNWCTYYGGPGDDYSWGIALDPLDNVYITGQTNSTTGISTPGSAQLNFGGSPNIGDAFIAKFNSTGTSLIWGTYYGGANDDWAYGIALDASNNVYITGPTLSDNNISTAGAYQTSRNGGNMFVAKFNSSGSSLLWGTYYGGPGGGESYGIAIDPYDYVFVTGYTISSTLIATPGAYQTSMLGNQDGFLSIFNPSGEQLVYGTYFGGIQYQIADRVALDATDNIYFSGETSSSGLATSGAYQTTLFSSPPNGDAYVVKFSKPNLLDVNLSSFTNVNCYGSKTGSATVIANGGTPPYTYNWSPSGGTNSTATGLSVGSYTCTITDASSNIINVQVTITQPPPLSVTASITPPLFGLCVGTPFNLTATATGGTGPYTYKWTWPLSNSYTGQNFPTFLLPNATVYTVTVTDANGCTAYATITANGNSNCCYLSCPSPKDIPSGAVSSSYGGGISSNNCVTISGPGKFSINNNFTISSSTIAMGSGATIDVQAPYTLTIAGSRLYACGDMWQGIKVEAGATLIIDNSTIEDAQTGVDVVNPNTTVSITSSTLNNNYYDIEFSRSPLANPAPYNFTLRNTTLTCKADAYSNNNYLKPPYAPGVITNSGVYIKNIGVGFPITVGDYTGSYLNTFSNMNYGVNSVNSSFVVYNNKFENLLGYTYQIPCTNSSGCPPPIGIAVLAIARNWYEGSDPTNYRAYYLATVGGSIGNQSNTMGNCYRGVDITEYAYPAVENNTMLNSTNLSPLPPSLSVSPYGDHGIYLKEPINPQVTNNGIQNFATGIHLYGFLTNSINNYPLISGNGNVSSNNITANSNGVLYSGIIAEDGIATPTYCPPNENPCPYTFYPLAIELNSIIDASYSCITLNNINCGTLFPAFVKVNNNTALQLAPAPANYRLYRTGIIVQNCSADPSLSQSFTISNNSIYSPGSVINSNTNNATNTHVIGIRGILSYGIIYKCNDIGNVGQCIRFDGDNCPSSIYRNHLTSCYDGFVLWNNGMIGQQGRPINMPISLGLPIADKWVGTPIINYFYHFETWTENSDATQSPLYVLNNPQQNPSLNSGNPPSTPYCYSSCTALDPQSIFTTSGEPPLCPPTICYTCQAIDASVKGEMHRAVHDSIPFFVFMPQSSYLSKQTVLSAITQDTALMSGDTVLQKFYNASQTNNMGIISSIAQQIQQGNISNALSLNNALNPTNIVEANHKAVYDVELHTLAVHIDTIDSLQYATLYNIASQCPLEGGRAVFHARALLNRLLNTSLIWNDSCNSDSVFNHRPKKLASTEETENPNPEFKLYPNPNSDNMILEYNISTSDNTKIVIFDMLGQEIYNSILPPNQNILNIHTNLPNGVYMYSIISTDSGILKTGKVVIIK